MDPGGQPLSAAQRRKQRRLRSWWRHEQQSIAAALATSVHHCALRGQKRARAREEESELHFTAMIRKTPPPQAAGTVYYPMDVDDVLAARGSRPDRLLDASGPQERAQRRTVEQIDDAVPVVPLLHTFVPQMVDQLSPQAIRHRGTRAGDRSAQDHPPRRHPTARGAPCAADGRTAGGRDPALLRRFRACCGGGGGAAARGPGVFRHGR